MWITSPRVRPLLLAALWLLGAGCDSAARFPDTGGRRPFGVQMHLHGSLSEGKGSMRGHLEEARRLGTVDAIWWSDHDWRIALHTYQRAYDFESGSLDSAVVVPRRRPGPLASGSDREGGGGGGDDADEESADADSVERCRVRWVPRAGRPRDGASFEVVPAPGGRAGRAGRLSAASPDSLFRASSWAFVADKGRARFPLASRLTLRLDMLPVQFDPADARFVVSCFLSQQPPDRKVGVINLVAGNRDARAGRWSSDSLHVVEVPLEEFGFSGDGQSPPSYPLTVGPPGARWSRIAIDLTRIAYEKGLGGADNSLTAIEIGLETRNGRRATVCVDDFALAEELNGDNLLAWEERFAAEPAASGDSIIQLVGVEISYSAHVNFFGLAPALPDFERFPGGLTAEEAVRFAHERGGLASLNHVFGAAMGETALRGGADERLGKILGELRESRCYGADLLEIGYPARVLTIEHFLALWDSLWDAGILIPGTGVSDSHDNDKGWREGNNFITWIWARSLDGPDLLAGLRSGALAFGNPLLTDGRAILVTEDGHAMGQVVEVAGEGARHRFRFTMEGAQADWTATPVVRGRRGTPIPLAGKDPVREVLFEAATPPGTWVRVEVRDAQGAVVLCTNPIAFTARDPNGVAPARLTRCGG